MIVRGRAVGALLMSSLLLFGLFSYWPVKTWGSASLVPHAPIWIRGDSDFTMLNGVISGSGTTEDPFVIEGSDVSVANSQVFFTVGARAGILVENTSAHFVIRSVVVHDGPGSSANIVLKSVANGRVEASRIIKGNMGVVLWFTSNSSVFDNDISGFGDGVRLSHSNGNVIFRNRIRDVQSPVFALTSSHNRYRGNLIEQFSYPYTVAGVSQLLNSSFNRFEDNTIRHGVGGVGLAFGSNHNVVSGNLIEHVELDGVLVGHSSGNIVENNTIIDAGTGIFLNHALETVVRSNWVSAFTRISPPGSDTFTGKGIWVVGSNSTRIIGNTITAPAGIGLCGSRATILGPHNNLTETGRRIEHFCS